MWGLKKKRGDASVDMRFWHWFRDKYELPKNFKNSFVFFSRNYNESSGFFFERRYSLLDRSLLELDRRVADKLLLIALELDRDLLLHAQVLDGAPINARHFASGQLGLAKASDALLKAHLNHAIVHVLHGFRWSDRCVGGCGGAWVKDGHTS
jgi:hypothetical protein